MKRFQKSRAITCCAIAFAVLPVLLWAYASGPPPRKTGAPGDSTCNQCHVGTPLNGGGGNVAIVFADGQATYTPGQKKRIQVVITDAVAKVYGFQASARLNSNPSTAQAGTFTPIASNERVICEDGSLRDSGSTVGTCKAAAPLEFIEHDLPQSSNTYSFDWTAPATDQGGVTIYVAANAANGDGDHTGDHIYTTSAALSVASAGSPPPTLAPGGIADAFTYQPGVSPESWIAIFGQNLASTTTDWNGADFSKGLPTSLGGVSVTMNGKPAVIYYVSPTLVNVLAPSDLGAGATQVALTNATGSASANLTSNAQLPAFYAPFAQGSNLFVTAVSPTTGEYLGKVGIDPRVTRALKPGELVSLYGTGFGAATGTPATTAVFSGAFPLVVNPTITIGGQVVPGVAGFLVSPGLYLFNITVPNLADGDVPIVASFGAVSSSNIVLVSIKK